MSQIGNQSTSACGGVGYVPVPPRLWSRAGGNNCPNCVSNNGYAACIGDNGLSYSTYDLDQRRKAEILKYKGNSAQLSRAQQYSMASRNALTRKKSWATQTQTYTNPNVDNLPEIQNAGGVTVSLQCNGSTVRCSLTSDSDVPGLVIPLCIDESVPLYNYKMQVTPASGGTGIYNLDGLVLPPAPTPTPVPTPAPAPIPVPPPAPTPALVEVILEVINATGQRIYLDANKSPSQNVTPTGYTVWIITNPNNLTSSACKILSSHSSPIPLSALVVAGGGASQSQSEDPEEGSTTWIGGGGGGGGVLSITSGASMVSGTQYNITVGKGGQTLNGEDSILNWNNGIATAIGGGGGSGNQSSVNGQNGGSGGGAGFISQAQITGSAGSGTPGPPVQGYNGGAYSGQGSGGGGGAGASGTSNNGGNGLQSAITGTPSYYGGGGAGVDSNGSAAGTGGQGGGGSMRSNLPGTDGLGGGAGSNYYGSISSTSIKGGNGVIILQFPSYY